MDPAHHHEPEEHASQMGIMGDIVLWMGLQSCQQFKGHIDHRQVLGFDRNKEKKIEVRIRKLSDQTPIVV